MSIIIIKGGSSGRLMVALPYTAERVEKIKTIPGRRWRPEEKCWSVPDAGGMLQRLLTLFAGEQVEVESSLRPVRRADHREPPVLSGSMPVVTPEPKLP
ncbi:MAG: hypothetical protein NZT92_17395, partial [Abditibacteriales bacterium]|nr:hypothetical protein [Abditibacteriales bacterium]MDW8367624.1 hypothetical protein [Abditibacteriales bacterium]